ncbi:MAG: hypothetical protein WCZ00_03875 [Acholeplasmataceae bacterium]
MRKYVYVILILLMSMLVISSVIYGWFTYVQRKSISTFVSNELVVEVKLNDDDIVQSKTLKNLAFIDFEDDLINDTNQMFNEVGQMMDMKLTLSESSPLSRFIFELDPIDEPLIYIIILDDQIIDYHLLISQIISPTDSKEDMLLSIDQYNQMQIDALSNEIVIPGQTKTFKIMFWADYDQLSIPSDYLTYTTDVSFKLTIINAYGEIS